MSQETKNKYYDKLYRALKRQQKQFEKSEFADLEYMQSLYSELTPRSQLYYAEHDAMLSRMAYMYLNDELTVTELRRQREEFYEDYGESLSDRFYKGKGRKTIDTEVYVEFVNFVETAHSTHLGEWLYDSDQIIDFQNEIGKEVFDSMDSDELYAEFYDYLQTKEAQAREYVGWSH